MKAAVLTQLNSPLEICDLVHGDPGFGQVLVKILQSGICGAQLAEIRGEKSNARFLPHLLGHEAAGEVLLVGPGVTRVKAGNKVICHWRQAAGVQSEPARYYCETVRAEFVGGGAITTFQEQALISENRLTPVPHDVSNDLSALLGCGLSTALGTIENEADLKFGETVLIIGCGGLGANLILAAKLRQASFISVVDVADKNCFALNMGADAFSHQVSHLRKFDFDVVIDTTGNEAAIAEGIGALGSGGRFVMVGQPNRSITIPNARDLFSGEGKRIIATQGGQFRPDKDIPRYVAMWRAGLLKLDGLVTHSFPLDEINQGLDLVRQGQAGRVMVMM